jgi:hypothetical protein
MPEGVEIALKREGMGDRYCALTKFASMNDYEKRKVNGVLHPRPITAQGLRDREP